MISKEDQNNLLQLVSRYLKKNVTCYAFGGNAMMFYGYKNATKDIDIIFETEEERNVFIDAIMYLGYKQMSMKGVYIENLCKEKHKPLMFTRGDERFDLFVSKIFQTQLSPVMKHRAQARHDYVVGEYSLIVFVLCKEDIVFLKSITQREKDFDDIRTIIEKESSFDWNIVINEAIFQSQHGDGWAILDLEETMKRLKEIVFIKKQYFDKLYGK
jgi:hypothetical protein